MSAEPPPLGVQVLDAALSLILQAHVQAPEINVDEVLPAQSKIYFASTSNRYGKSQSLKDAIRFNKEDVRICDEYDRDCVDIARYYAAFQAEPVGVQKSSNLPILSSI